MVSIRKYLDIRQAREPALPGDEFSDGASELSSRLIRQFSEYLSSIGAATDVLTALEQARELALTAVSRDSPKQIETAVKLALIAHATKIKDEARGSAAETHRIVSVLNDALLALTGGSKRSEGRLARIQESLERSSLIRDVEGMRKSLAEAVKLIQEERVSEQEHSSRDIAALTDEVLKVRQHLASDPLRRMPGRVDAIRQMSDMLAKVQPGNALYAVAFLINGLSAIVSRYGPVPMESMFFQVIREKVEPIVKGNMPSRWSPSCVVALFESSADFSQLKSSLTERCRTPLLFSVVLGNRTAALNLGLSQLFAPIGVAGVERAVEELDRFSGAETACNA